MTTQQLKTLHYSFSSDISELLRGFAKVHQHDDRKQYQEEWTKWLELPEIKPEMEKEIKRLRDSGIEGDVYLKMYKSARYYYRNKPTTTSDARKPARKIYEKTQPHVLEIIDRHINDIIREHTNNKNDKNDKNNKNKFVVLTPAFSYERFYTTHTKLLRDLLPEYETKEGEPPVIPKTAMDELKESMKKTYKNRFYAFRVRNNI
jgi:hypothetical protein